MRTLITIILTFVSSISYAQETTSVETIIADSGKFEFNLQAKKDTADYSKAYRILTNQVKLKSQ